MFDLRSDTIRPVLWRLAGANMNSGSWIKGAVMTAMGARPRETRGGSRLNVKALVAFFALAYALSWSWAIPLTTAQRVVRRGEGSPWSSPGMGFTAGAAARTCHSLAPSPPSGT